MTIAVFDPRRGCHAHRFPSGLRSPSTCRGTQIAKRVALGATHNGVFNRMVVIRSRDRRQQLTRHFCPRSARRDWALHDRIRRQGIPGQLHRQQDRNIRLHDDGLPRCWGMVLAYCVDPGRVLDAVMLGRDGARVPLQFVVGDSQDRRERDAGASDDVAEAANVRLAAFIWGRAVLPRQAHVSRQRGQDVPGTRGLVGPFYAVR